MTSWLPVILFVVLGIFVIVQGILARKRAKETESWPTVPGTVLSSEVITSQRYDSDAPGHQRTTYTPSVNYQYSVMGQVYTSKRISFGEKNAGRKKCNEIVARYPAGSPVNVRYNPEKPDEAVLESSARGSTGNIILGIVFFALAIFFIFQMK